MSLTNRTTVQERTAARSLQQIGRQMNGRARPYTRGLDPAKFKYKIETGIPVPRVNPGGGKRRRETELRFPLRLMEVGDSFFVPAADYIDHARMGWVNVNQAINTAQQRSEKRFCWRTRTLEEHKEDGWRVWRTK